MMNITEIENWLQAQGFILSKGYWRKGEWRYSFSLKSLKLEYRDDDYKWRRICSGYFSQLSVGGDGKIRGMV
jgi:hypothetical protein